MQVNNIVDFQNCEVPVWKVRKGVVVGYTDQKSGEMVYGHVRNFAYRNFLVIEDWSGCAVPYCTFELVWLEPI